MQKINTQVIMSGAEYFDDGFAINALMDDHVPVDVSKAVSEHNSIREAFENSGINVVKVDPPVSCQDGVYTANWAVIYNGKAIMSNLPPTRQPEEAYAEEILRNLGLDIVNLPREYAFSGQGDALPCGRYIFVGTGYRTSLEVHDILARETGLEVVGIQAIPALDDNGKPVINAISGWPDSLFYDLDLAIAVIAPTLIAWCPDAMDQASQEKIRTLHDIDKIEVSYEEAVKASACNLVSTGETVIMGSQAPLLRQELENRGFRVIALEVTELMKGGGFIRCTSLSL